MAELGTLQRSTRPNPGSFERTARTTGPVLSDVVPTPDTGLEDLVNNLSQAASVASQGYINYQVNQVENTAEEARAIAQEDLMGKLSQAQAQQLARSSETFRRYAQARMQGAMPDTAVDIAVESEIKRVSNAFPMLSDAVKEEAVRQLGFDPTGAQYEFLVTQNQEEERVTTLYEEARAKAEQLATPLGLDVETVTQRLLSNIWRKQKILSREQKSKLNALPLSEEFQTTQMRVSNDIDLIQEQLVLSMTEQGVSNVKELSPEDFAGLKATVDTMMRNQIDAFRKSVIGVPGATAQWTSQRVAEIRTRYNTLKQSLDDFTKEEIIGSRANISQDALNLFINNRLPLVRVFSELGVKNPVNLVSGLVGEGSGFAEELARNSDAARLLLGDEFQSLDKLKTTMQGIFSGDTDLLTRMYGATEASNMIKTGAAAAVRGEIGQHGVTGNALVALSKMSPDSPILDQIMADGTLNNAESHYMDVVTSSPSINGMAQEIRSALGSNLQYVKGIQIEDDGTVSVELNTGALPDNPNEYRFIYREIYSAIGGQLSAMENVVNVLRNPVAANSIGVSTSSYASMVNQAIDNESVTRPTGRDNLQEMTPVSEDFVRNIGKDLGMSDSLADFTVEIARAESNLGRSAAVSSAGAVGIMQLMPDTARVDLGLVVNDTIDQRYDEETNVRAGARYIQTLNENFDGDYVLMAAAYNWGMGNVWSLINDDYDAEHGSDNISISSIPQETRSYVKKVTGLDMAQYLRRQGYVETY